MIVSSSASKATTTNGGTTDLRRNTAMSIISETAEAASLGDKQGLKDVLDFLVTEESTRGHIRHRRHRACTQHTVGGVSAGSAQRAVTQEFHHVEALKDAGGTQFTTSYWFPDAAFGNGGVGLFSTLEVVETIEISLYLIGVSAYARCRRGVRCPTLRRGDGDRSRSPRACAASPGHSSEKTSAFPTMSALRTTTGRP